MNVTQNIHPADLKARAAICCAALDYRSLAFDAKFGPAGTVKKLFINGNQRTFSRLLVSESFGIGQEWGQLDAMAFHHILANGDRASTWRVDFIHKQMAEFKRNGWMVTDGTGRYKLLPDRWPNWVEVRSQMKARDPARLKFEPDDELNSMLAKISQSNAVDSLQVDFLGGERFSSNKMTGEERTGERIAPAPPKPPDPPPEPIGNPSRNRRNRTAETEPPKPKTEAAAPFLCAFGNSGTSVIRREEKIEHRITDVPIVAHENFQRQLDEVEMMRTLGELLGLDEMRQAEGHWRVDHVRKHPILLGRLIIQLQELVNIGWKFKTNRAAWLESSIKKEIQRGSKDV